MSIIKQFFKKLIFSIIYFSGITVLIREFIQRDKVTILLFHDLNANLTIKSFLYFKKRYNIISLKDFLESRKIGKALPKKSMILTFDDGLKSNYETFKIIKQLEISATIFIVSGVIGTKKGYWWNHNSSRYSNEELKKIDDDKRIKILRDNFFDENLNLDKRESLSIKEINEMKDFIDFQSHSVTHPILTNCSFEKAQFEINESKSALEKLLNKNVNAFAYPNGNYSRREADLVRDAGYECAISCDFGFNTNKTDLMNLKRISGGVGLSLHEIIVKSSGLYNYLIRQ